MVVASVHFCDIHFRRGSMLSTTIFVYAATSPINGYFGGSLYARMGGKQWIKQMLLSAFIVPALVCGTAFFINFIAIYYHASRAIPFGTMVSISNIQPLMSNNLVYFCIGCSHMHLHLCDSTADADRNDRRSQLRRSAGLPVSSECRSSTHSGKEMVYGTPGDHFAGRCSTLRIDLH